MLLIVDGCQSFCGCQWDPIWRIKTEVQKCGTFGRVEYTPQTGLFVAAEFACDMVFTLFTSAWELNQFGLGVYTDGTSSKMTLVKRAFIFIPCGGLCHLL